MNYKVNSYDEHKVIEVSGKADRGSVITAASYIRELEIEYQQMVILDVSGLEDEREMFYHAALINSIKKEVEFAGGIFRIRTGSEALRGYLSMTGLERLFIFDEPHAASLEEQISDFQRC